MYMQREHKMLDDYIETCIKEGTYSHDARHDIVQICNTFYNQGWDDAAAEETPRTKVGTCGVEKASQSGRAV